VKAIQEIWRDPKPGEYTNGHWKFVIPDPVEEIGLKLHLKPFQDPHPPIAVGGVSSNSHTLEIAGQNGWIPLSINLLPIDSLRGHWESYSRGADKTDILPDRENWRIARDIYVAETDEIARREAKEGTLGRDYEKYWLKLLPWSNNLDQFKLDVEMPDDEITLDYLMENVWIVGSPETVALKIRAIFEKTGGFGTLLAMGHEWKPRKQWIDSMTLLADEVMPQVNSF
jgi:alkanesulfonate monooxygenase SsuD/methylene tetrahydromethanopterin reductase-like flavin-dependent oxidoreductase (luciferase family)